MDEEQQIERDNQKTRRENYERILFAIAVLYSGSIDLDIKKQDSYSKMTPYQKTFAKKIAEETPSVQDALQQTERVTEQEVVEQMSQLAQTRNNTRKLRIVTVGDERVCEKCAKWNRKVVSLDETGPSPTLQDAIDDGFLHYGCRCSLQELSTSEIPLNPLNPRYDERRRANPSAYNSSLNGKRLVFL